MLQVKMISENWFPTINSAVNTSRNILLQGEFIKIYANDQKKISCGEFLVTVNCDYVISIYTSGFLIEVQIEELKHLR